MTASFLPVFFRSDPVVPGFDGFDGLSKRLLEVPFADDPEEDAENLRAGPVNVSVLVQDRANGQPALDGEVFVRLQKEGGMTLIERATREVAQNKLLYSALTTLPEAGRWELEVTVKQEKEAASVLGQVSAGPARLFLLSYWRSLSLPPVVVALFALNQRFKRKRCQSEDGRRQGEPYTRKQRRNAVAWPLMLFVTVLDCWPELKHALKGAL